MNVFLVAAFLFFLGSVVGWVIEVLFRRFISKKNPERKWINPGFCIGPYLPLYGTGLVVLYFLTYVQALWIPETWWGIILMIVIMALAMTLVEYSAGLIALKIFHTRLWDYTGEWGNIQGLICPKFTLIWAAAAAAYVFLVHPLIIDDLIWLSKHLTFSFFIGLFFGVFIIDVCYSAHLASKVRKFAKDHEVVVHLEHLKTNIKHKAEEEEEKVKFMFPLKNGSYLEKHIDDAKDTVVNSISEPKAKKKESKQ